MQFVIREDCRHFKGDHPCKFWRPCMGCQDYSPVTRRVLIVMLIKLGDMLIASPLPKALKMQVPGTHVSWLVDSSCADLLRMNPYIDEVYEYSWDSVSALETCSFDLVLGFEREKAAAALVEKIQAVEKHGLAFGGEHNGLYPLCAASGYFFRLNVWNDFRTKINTKTWTEFYFELAGLKYQDEPYQLEVSAGAQSAAFNQITGTFGSACRPLLFNLGGSIKTKLWPTRHWTELIRLCTNSGFKIILTYGRDEEEMLGAILHSLSPTERKNVIAPDTSKDLGILAALFQLAEGVVSGDTLGMHLAIWSDKPTVVLFGPSNPAEVVPKSCHRLEIVQTTFECSPCAHQVVCGGVGGCMGAISVEQVFQRLQMVLSKKPIALPKEEIVSA